MKLGTRWAALALALGVVAGCDGGTDSDFGEVSLRLTDAAGEDVVEAWVTFTDVYLQGEGGEQDPPGGRVYLLADVNESFELTSLANAVADLVEGVEVPTGTYGQLRVVMSGGCVETDDGSIYASSEDYTRCGGDITGELRMPSMQQSGVKVLLNGLQVTGGQHILLLDFDVEDSFGHAAGNSGAWVMTPVIHTSEIGLTAGIDVSLSAGDATLPEGFDLDGFSATLLPTDGDSSTVALMDEDQNGIYEASFLFLIPAHGPFEVRLDPPEGATVTVVGGENPVTVELDSGETAAVEFTLETVVVVEAG